MTSFLTMINGRQTMQSLPVRRVGALMHFVGQLPTGVSSSGFFLDYDGYWVLMTDDVRFSIGNSSSTAGIAQAWLFNLYQYIWQSYTNSVAPVLDAAGTVAPRGATALADWNANKPISFPDFKGRTLIASGRGLGLTARSIGEFVGAETHTLSINEMPPHNHAPSGRFFNELPGGNFQLQATGTNIHSLSFPTSQGSGQAHNNIQPSVALPLFISAGARA